MYEGSAHCGFGCGYVCRQAMLLVSWIWVEVSDLDLNMLKHWQADPVSEGTHQTTLTLTFTIGLC
jgi:hypothetical protein